MLSQSMKNKNWRGYLSYKQRFLKLTGRIVSKLRTWISYRRPFSIEWRNKLRGIVISRKNAKGIGKDSDNKASKRFEGKGGLDYDWKGRKEVVFDGSLILITSSFHG
jgi:hypothetical protein